MGPANAACGSFPQHLDGLIPGRMPRYEDEGPITGTTSDDIAQLIEPIARKLSA